MTAGATPDCSRARAKLAEVEDRIADLTTIRDTLRAALDAGCDDLIACAGDDCCPIPFATITTRPHADTTQDGSSR